MHVAGADDELDAVRLEPLRERDVALLAARVVRRAAKTAVAMFAASARSSARTPALVRGDRGDRQPRVEQRLEVRPLAADEHADHAIRPITRSPGSASRDDSAAADAEVEDAAQLVLLDVAGEPVEDRRPLPRVPVDLRAAAGGDDALEVAEDAAAGHVGERRAPGRAGARTTSR